MVRITHLCLPRSFNDNGLDLGADSKVYRHRVATRTISETAGDAGVSTDTLRYYERLGLVQPTARTASGYRLYNPEAPRRVMFIKGAQRLGLRLGDIKQLLDIRDRGACPCGHTRALLQQQLDDVDTKLVQLAALRRELTDILERADDCPGTTPGTWWCETELTQKGGAQP
jgi:DNA-binding transcriptional MerR regulator